MRQRRLRYLIYAFIFILSVSAMTYFLFGDELPHKVPLRAKEVMNYLFDKSIYYTELCNHGG
jgi:hypothetical protein